MVLTYVTSELKGGLEKAFQAGGPSFPLGVTTYLALNKEGAAPSLSFIFVALIERRALPS